MHAKDHTGEGVLVCLELVQMSIRELILNGVDRVIRVWAIGD
jgi:hypothetical protein